jgi:hypothetical protein
MTKDLAPSPVDVEAFLEKFFAAPNAISLQDIEVGGEAEHLLPWVGQLRKDTPLPTILPNRRDGRIWWYALAFSDAQLRILGEQLLSFVGPTYSTFRGHQEGLNGDDPIDGTVALLTNGFAFKFTGPKVSDKPKPIWEHLELMREVLARRPVRTFDSPRATGRVLRDFAMAVRAGNATSAEEHLRYLRDHRRVTPSNLLFLRIQALAELGNWDELLASPELSDLLQMRRPLAVTESLLRAVYRRELKPFEEKKDIEGAVAHFKAAVLPSYSSLFVRRTGMHATEALKALMLLAVAGQDGDPELRDTLLRTPGLADSDINYLKLLGDRLPPTNAAPEVPASLELALAARDRGDYEGAYSLAVGSPESAKRARLLIECAYELQTIEAEGAAVAAIASLTPESQEEALKGRRIGELYDRLRPDPDAGNKGQLLPASWTEWIVRVTEEPEWIGALDFARRGAREWRIEDLLTNGEVESLTKALETTSGGVTLQNALPYLVSFLETDPLWPRPEFGDLYRRILALLATGSAGSDDDVRVYIDIAQNVLGLGVDSKAYREMMSELSYLLTSFASPSRIVWGLEALEVAVTYPCPDPESRLQLLMDVFGLTQKFRRRSDQAHNTALRLLCYDLEQHGLADSLQQSAVNTSIGDAGAGDILRQLNERSVAIYTLTERAGRYMEKILAERAPRASVRLAHDTVGSESLKHLAKGADIFIMATASSTHAATGFIEANRPKDRPTLRPRGKGMASMLSALEEFLQQELSEAPLELAS